MKQLIKSALLAGAVVLAVAAPVAASSPVVFSTTDTFLDVDPCTGNIHEVTIDVTFYVHDHNGDTVARAVRTVSTSAGYEGGGVSSYVFNGQVEKFAFSDVLANGSGDRIRARGVFVLDLANGEVRAESSAFVCLG